MYQNILLLSPHQQHRTHSNDIQQHLSLTNLCSIVNMLIWVRTHLVLIPMFMLFCVVFYVWVVLHLSRLIYRLRSPATFMDGPLMKGSFSTMIVDRTQVCFQASPYIPWWRHARWDEVSRKRHKKTTGGSMTLSAGFRTKADILGSVGYWRIQTIHSNTNHFSWQSRPPHFQVINCILITMRVTDRRLNLKLEYLDH